MKELEKEITKFKQTIEEKDTYLAEVLNTNSDQNNIFLDLETYI